MKKTFSLGAVLSVLTYQDFESHMFEVGDLIEFLTGRGKAKETFFKVCTDARASLIKQFPILGSDIMILAHADLLKALGHLAPKDQEREFEIWVESIGKRIEKEEFEVEQPKLSDLAWQIETAIRAGANHQNQLICHKYLHGYTTIGTMYCLKQMIDQGFVVKKSSGFHIAPV